MKRSLFAVVAACLLPLLIDAACSRRQAPAVRPNVLLVTIDTLRADRLTPQLTPTLERLAAGGVRFTAARTAVPLTLPAHATIMTGLLPPAHGVRLNGVDRLSGRHATIAGLLKHAGYETAAFVGAFVLDRRFGLAQGFDTYDDRIARDPRAADRLDAERPASAVVDRALGWLAAPGHDGSGSPFFVWIHLYDPHAPYTPPPEFLARAQALASSSHEFPATARDRYDGEVMYADSQIARVVSWLAGHNLLDRTLVVVAGDHGEGLGEHEERTHGMLLYDSTLRVPLIARLPGGPSATRTDPVSLADIAPTIVRAASVRVPQSMQGRDLFSGSTPSQKAGDIYAETEYPRVAGWSPLQALIDGRWKAIRSGTTTEMYDLGNDPAERRDVGSAQAATARGMLARIDAIRAGAEPSRAGQPVSSETAERLRALGYVASAAATPAATAWNPAAAIETWNAFEDALGALNAKPPDGVAELRRLASANPDAPVFQTTYARALKDARQLRPALDVYRGAARRWPTDATLLHDLAVAAREAAAATNADSRALRDEAARAERAALALDSGSAAAHNGLGLLAVDEQEPAAAAREFEQATALDPTNASYWTNLGNARRAAGDRAAAEQAYRQALSVEPENVDALNGTGVLLVEAGRPAEAAPLLDRVVAASPGFVEGRLNLGIALQQSGQPARAAEAYRGVLAAPGNHPREKQAAARLLASLGAHR